MSEIYTPKRSAFLVVPNDVHAELNRRLDVAIGDCPDALADREHLYNSLLGFFDEYGYIPEFSVSKAEDK